MLSVALLELRVLLGLLQSLTVQLPGATDERRREGEGHRRRQDSEAQTRTDGSSLRDRATSSSRREASHVFMNPHQP